MIALAQKPTVFSKRLAEARLRSGLSQAQLGLEAGLDPSVASPRINQYEQGKHEPKHEMAQRLAKVLGIPAAFLYCEDDQLAKLLLLWSQMTASEKKELLKQMEVGQKER